MADETRSGVCPRCEGSGQVPATYLPHGEDPEPGSTTKCPDCGGTGKRR